MVLVIISYIQKKSYDYVLLDTMGLKKKHRYMFIGFEYAGIIFSSVTGGLILGKILAECAKTVLQNIFYNTITTEVNYGFVALRNTLVISCEVFGILFIVFDEVIACLGMDALLTVGKKNENFTPWDIFDLDWSYKFIVLLGKDIQKYSDCIFECGHVPAYDQLGRILFCSVE